jgi:hypothetical protein
MTAASFILGTIGLLLACFSWIGYIGLLVLHVTVPGIILGAIGRSIDRKNNKPTSVATAGLVISILGTIIILFHLLPKLLRGYDTMF